MGGGRNGDFLYDAKVWTHKAIYDGQIDRRTNKVACRNSCRSGAKIMNTVYRLNVRLKKCKKKLSASPGFALISPMDTKSRNLVVKFYTYLPQ